MTSNWRRIALAVIGIAIGIGAITSMLVIGYSATAQATRMLDRLGGDVVTLTALSQAPQGPDTSGGMAARFGSGLPDALTGAQPARLTDGGAAVLALLRSMPDVKAVARVWPLMPCRTSNTGLGDTQVFAADAGLPQVISTGMSDGRFFLPGSEDRPWVVAGASAYEELRRKRPGLRPGSSMELCGRLVYLLGVLTPYPGDEVLTTLKVNRSIFVSESSVAALGGSLEQPQILARVPLDGVNMPQSLARRLDAALGANSGLSFQAVGAVQINDMRQQQVSLYLNFLTALGVVALAVGSLGITNVMLVSVSERRSEIGLRMALGAAPADIALQFIAESVFVCLCGALLGVVLGMLGAIAALLLAGIEFALSPSMPLACGALAVVSGVLAGAHPAMRAARMNPVATLQA
ncbi:MAG: ABC transporter permease [Burkholderiales bacterium]|nr:ABC transporter permease [Burkholderiales bacterium]